MANWRYKSETLFLFYFILITSIELGVSLRSNLARKIFVTEASEHICGLDPNKPAESLETKDFAPTNGEGAKSLTNGKEKTPPNEKNVLDTLKVFLKKVKDEVVEDAGKCGHSERRDGSSIAYPESIITKLDGLKKLESDVDLDVSPPQTWNNLVTSRKMDKFSPSSIPPTEYEETSLKEPVPTASQQDSTVSQSTASQDHGSRASESLDLDKTNKKIGIKKKTKVFVSRQSKGRKRSGAETVDYSPGTTPQADNFVQSTAPWTAPTSSGNISTFTLSETAGEPKAPDEGAEEVLLPRPESSAEVDTKEEPASASPTEEEPAPLAQLPEGNVTATSAEADSPAEESTPPQEQPDDAQKDQLETYSQFAERVTAEKKNGVSGSNGHSGNGQLAKGPKVNTKNYASTVCGAKFLAANPESSHSHKLINYNKDEYMLNKCTSKIWAMVELCESIRPQKFGIANFELFSNSPKDIYLFGSHRYPTREWTQLGAYEGEEGNRDVQSFTVETQEFFKFVKLEVHSYYGTEFFCPLSQFQIYGLSEFEVIEETEDADEEEVLEEPKPEEDNKDKPGMIPAVIKSMVSGMLEVIKRGSRSGNRSYEPELNTFTQSCRSLHGNFSIAEAVCPFAESLNYILACYYDEYLKLIANPFIASVVQNKDFCHRLATVVCASPQTDDRLVYDSVCNNSYACVMLSPKHLLAMCHMQVSLALTAAEPSNKIVEQPEQSNVSYLAAELPDAARANASPPHQNLAAKVDTAPDQAPPGTAAEIEGSPGSVTPSNPASSLDAAREDAKEDAVHVPRVDAKSPAASKDAAKKSKEPKSPLPESSPNATISPPTLDKNSSVERKGEKESPEKTPSGDDVHSVAPGTASTSVASPPAGSGEARVASHSNKESVVVRLSNKIKVLESNMSISSQYLEELSQRYKRQMEDLQRQFNITFLALNMTSQAADERDILHHQRLEVLEGQMLKLAEEVATLVEEKENLMTRVVEQHMILLCVEVVVMFLVFSLCLRRRRKEVPRAPAANDYTMKIESGSRCEEDSLLQPEADLHGRETPSLSRRRSVDSIRSESEAKPKERRFSGHLTMTGSYKDLLIADLTNAKEKKRRKKKARLERSLSNASISEKSRLSAKTKKEKKLEKLKRSSAGVLFGGEKGKDELHSHRPNGQAVKVVSPDEWHVIRKGKGRNKLEIASPFCEEPNVLSSDLKRGKITVDEHPMGSMYPHQYYTQIPFDHGAAVYSRDCLDIQYNDISIYDYQSELQPCSVAEEFGDVYLPDLHYGSPVVSDYYSTGAEGISYSSGRSNSLKNGSHLEDSVDASFLSVVKSPKLLSKSRSCAEFQSPSSTASSSAFKGRTKLRSDNWEWYSSQPSRLLSSLNSTATEVVSNSSSDSSNRSKGVICATQSQAIKPEKKKKKKNKGAKLTNGESR